MSFIAEIGLSKIRPEERLHTSGAIENIDGVGATQARWVPVQNCNPGDASKKGSRKQLGTAFPTQDPNHPPRTRNRPNRDRLARKWTLSGCGALQHRRIEVPAGNLRDGSYGLIQARPGPTHLGRAAPKRPPQGPRLSASRPLRRWTVSESRRATPWRPRTAPTLWSSQEQRSPLYRWGQVSVRTMHATDAG